MDILCEEGIDFFGEKFICFISLEEIEIKFVDKLKEEFEEVVIEVFVVGCIMMKCVKGKVGFIYI